MCILSVADIGLLKIYFSNVGYNSITYLILNQINITVVLYLLNCLNFPKIVCKIIVLPIVLLLLFVDNKILNIKKIKFVIGK